MPKSAMPLPEKRRIEHLVRKLGEIDGRLERLEEAQKPLARFVKGETNYLRERLTALEQLEQQRRDALEDTVPGATD